MDTTIRNIDEAGYRRLRALAAMQGKTVGQLINAAIIAYLDRRAGPETSRSILALKPEPYPAGNEELSESVDAVVYGSAVTRAKRKSKR
jgi:hypothetical protein